MTTKPTAQDFDALIEEFWFECDTADDERLAQIDEVITTLVEEKFDRGLGLTVQDALFLARKKMDADIDGKTFEIWMNHEVRLEPNFAELEKAIVAEFC